MHAPAAGGGTRRESALDTTYPEFMSDRRWVCPSCEAFHAAVPSECRLCGTPSATGRGASTLGGAPLVDGPEPPAPTPPLGSPQPLAGNGEPRVEAPAPVAEVSGDAGAPADVGKVDADPTTQFDTPLDPPATPSPLSPTEPAAAGLVGVGPQSATTDDPTPPGVRRTEAPTQSSGPITQPTMPLGRVIADPPSPVLLGSGATPSALEDTEPAAVHAVRPVTAEPRPQRSGRFIAVASGLVAGVALLAVLGFIALVSGDDEDAGATVARDRSVAGTDTLDDPTPQPDVDGPRSEQLVADAATPYSGSQFFSSQIDTSVWEATDVDEERSYGWRTLFQRADGSFIAVDVGKAENPGSSEEAARAIAASVGDRLLVGPQPREDRPDVWYIEFTGLSGDNRIDVFHVVDGRAYATLGATSGDLESLRADVYHLVDNFETR